MRVAQKTYQFSGTLFSQVQSAKGNKCAQVCNIRACPKVSKSKAGGFAEGIGMPSCLAVGWPTASRLGLARQPGETVGRCHQPRNKRLPCSVSHGTNKHVSCPKKQ